ncbi:YqcC family protein [Colwellia sp. TT2012]|uniref:YqcC family protein n=1 Tax=Colwellia sp. TT2012 TaxID=1720342 RepID=UPI000B0E7F43|nr:YqcC family protein [Colwellia sp. TT2012]
MMKKHLEHTTALLAALTTELKLLKLWQTQQPSAVELASSAPFCCDSLAFEQWLQFVFIPRITQLINQQQALPSKIALRPMAEESFKQLSAQALLAVINKIDQTLTGQGDYCE